MAAPTSSQTDRNDVRAALFDLVARSATLFERLSDPFQPDPARSDPAVVEQRLERWTQAVGKGSRELFEMRLGWDGLDLATATRAVGEVRLADHARLPAWAVLLEEYLAALGASTGNTDTAPDGRRSFPQPFEEVLAPLVQVAKKRLLDRTGDTEPWITPPALASFERALLARMAILAQEALLVDFERMRAPHYSGLARLFAVAEDESSREIYDQFIEDLRRGGMLKFFQRYPVLARQLPSMALSWVDFVGDLLAHLAADRDALDALFPVSSGAGEPLGPVTEVFGVLSDPHHGGRTVTALTFRSGQRLVYKPKSLGAERAFSHLIEWINERGELLPLHPLRVLDGGDHGWVEFIENSPLEDPAAAARFYRRAGMLLCLAYLLEATDCHYENIIACGEQPILVDLETLMHHRGRRVDIGEGAQAQLMAGASLDHSVLRTGLLPHWEVTGEDQVAFDVSGLGTEGEQTVSAQVPRWEHINTDRMTVRLETGTLAPRANAPHLDNKPVKLAEHTDELVAGFDQMYRLLEGLGQELLEADSPLAELGRERVRYVFRPTRTYALMQINLSSPQYLRDGIERSLYIEHLARASSPQDDRHGQRPPYWSLLTEEEAAMEQGDIPHFLARPTSDGVELPSGETLGGMFGEPSFDVVTDRIRAMGEVDRTHQIGLIRASLYANLARSGGDSGGDHATTDPGAVAPESEDSEAGTPLSTEELLARARQIGDEIAQRAVLASDGSAAWIAPQYLVEAERYQLQAIDHSLYGGTTGVALFLAALERATGGAGQRELALSALRSLKWAAETSGEMLTEVMGIGGGTGLGSAVWSMVRVSQWLDAPEVLADARTVGRLITPALIEDDVLLDVTSGSAGALLGLLALHEAGGDPDALERAVLAGERLLATRVASAAGPRSWPTHEAKLTTGFSHGAAGIAYALLRLSTAVDRPDFAQAALEAIDYENSLYSTETGNWADFRDGEEGVYIWSWCHGAPGIGLARLGSLRAAAPGGEAQDRDALRRDVERALATTEGFGFRLIDHVCCGNMGRVDVLLAAGQALDRPEWIAAAQSLAARVVRRADQNGAFVLHPLLPKELYNPGFFQGSAGIGYQLLRLAKPGLLPSVLMLE